MKKEKRKEENKMKTYEDIKKHFIKDDIQMTSS